METLMTIADVAEKLQLTEATIRKYVLAKVIPYIKIGAAIRFRPSEIEEWINDNQKSIPQSVKKPGRMIESRGI